LLALQALDLYPNKICGNLALKGYFRTKGYVWCMVNPLNVKEIKEFLESENINFVTDDNLNSMYHHEFTQAGNTANIITNFTVSTININGEDIDKVSCTSGPVTLYIHGLTVQRLTSTMYGFGVSDAAFNRIVSQFSTPTIIPSQQLIYNSFPIAATGAGVQAHKLNIVIHNTEELNHSTVKCINNPDSKDILDINLTDGHYYLSEKMDITSLYVKYYLCI